MTERWDAASTVTLVADGGQETLKSNQDSQENRADLRDDCQTVQLVTYGLVARVALSRPGFGFRIEHDLPPGVELVTVKPRATVVGDHLIWQIGRVDPGQEVRLEVVVRPLPGTVLSADDLATFTGTYSQNLYFQAPIVRPRLSARVSGPSKVTPGKIVEFFVDVANIGSWLANDVEARITLPEEFEHPDGRVSTVSLGTLKPGEFRRMTMPGRAISAGSTFIRVAVTGTDAKQSSVEFPTTVG